MTRQSYRRWFLLAALAGCASSLVAADEPARPRPAATVAAPSFTADVLPLLRAKCFRCHGDTVRKGELALNSLDAIRRGSESGSIVVAGKSAESRLFEVLRDGEMPPDNKNPLTDAEIERIRKWIDGGATFGDEESAARPDVTQHDVIPILLLRCTVCHGGRKQEGQLDLRTRASLLRGGKSGPAIVPGKPNDSRLLRRILAEEMPPRQRLIEATVKPMEADEVRKLARWIELGAPEIADEPDVAGTAADPLVTPTDRSFWSFQPPRRPAVPEIRTPTFEIRNAIDAFVHDRLAKAGLMPSPDADKFTLIRRATFGLTGLPPDPADVDAFVADAAPDAYEKLIDRLLASPRYGERWGRHWLDVAGYADCEGRREQHLPRLFAWRYRDYVIRSFNSDKPFDRFLVEQLAGDELADYEHAAEITQELEDNLVATAFLRMAPDPTWANLTGFVPDRLEVMADAMDVLGSGVMGLTFKCARCHSHKFDPLPQRDYYRLVAVFKGAYDEHDWLKPEIQSYGGAVSAGLGERYLPFVTSAERERWREHHAKIQRDVDTLKAGPASPETDKRIKELEAQRLPEPRLMALWDRGDPSPTYIYRRGDYLTAGHPVQPGPPAVLSDPAISFKIQPPSPGAKSTGRRLAFARWLTRPDHPLTARVMVNRIWKHHFGRGLVRSPGNFGKTGDPPTHPELLDWLACELVRSGWSVKSLHRLMLTSNTYRQASRVARHESGIESEPPSARLAPRDARRALDPGNRLLARMPLRRMEAEVLRDTLLAVSGRLDETRFGPADPVQALGDGLVLSSRRRSIYVQQLRKQPPTLLDTFDLPAMNPNCLERSESLVAPQALHLLNDATVRELAEHFADRVRADAGDDPVQQVRRAFAIALSRPPSATELAACVDTLGKLTDEWMRPPAGSHSPSKPDAARKALATVCHTLLNSAMFLYID